MGYMTMGLFNLKIMYFKILFKIGIWKKDQLKDGLWSFFENFRSKIELLQMDPIELDPSIVESLDLSSF